MVQLPLNAVAEVSNLLMKRLRRKPNWRREEIIEELEGALNDWMKKHNLVAIPVDRQSPITEAHVTIHCAEPFPWELERWQMEDQERDRVELARLSAPIPSQPMPVEGIRIDGVLPKPEPTGFTTIRKSWERSDSWLSVEALRAVFRSVRGLVRRTKPG